MKESIDIQFVSDIMCPWCVVGLANLNNALSQLEDKVSATIVFQPFELNPNMPKEGQGFQEHITEKYGITKAQSDQNRLQIKARGKEMNFDFNFNDESRMRNSFDAHRLLYWAEQEDKQAELKMALFKAHFTNNQDISNHDVLAKLAAAVGLNATAAKGILESNQYMEDIRQKEVFWQQTGITAVPTIIINNKYTISGGQPVESFKQAIEDILEKEQQEN